MSRKRDERGAALVITVLVSLAMTAIGIIALTTATTEVALTNNERMLTSAQYLAETGMMYAMQRIQAMGSASLLRERQRLMDEAPQARITFSLDAMGEDGVFVMDDNPQNASFGPERMQAEFTVEVESMRTAPPPPGYQLNTDHPPQSLEVGLVAEGRIGRLDLLQQQGNATGARFSKRRVWALVPVP